MQVNPAMKMPAIVPTLGPERSANLTEKVTKDIAPLDIETEAPEIQSNQDWTNELISRGADPEAILGFAAASDADAPGASADARENRRLASMRAMQGYETSSKVFADTLERDIIRTVQDTIAERAVATAFQR